MLDQRIINEILGEIQGSCHDLWAVTERVLEDHCGEDYELSMRDEMQIANAVDEMYFQCAQCGWWRDVGDYAENQDNSSGDICINCGDE